MSRPGTTVTRSTVRPARSARTGTGPWFVVGPTGTADTDPLGPRKPCTNITEYATRFGTRAAHVNDGGGGAGQLFDQAYAYFKGGGAELFVSPATYNATAGTYETNIALALAQFTRDLGAGQVSVPGRVTAATRLAVAAHAELNDRIAVLASTNTAVVATLSADATIASITPAQERRTSLWSPWVTISDATQVTRTVGPECIVAAAMAKNDGDGITPNQPSAGVLGISDVAVTAVVSFIDADRATLNAVGVNVLRSMFDGIRIYGYRTLADATTDPDWVNLANARLFMAIEALAEQIMERFVFRQLDGQRLTINEFGGALTGMLLPFWERGSLYGVTPEEAFRVDVGPNVNTDQTIANRELHANIALRVSEFAEEVILELVKTRITEAI